MNKFVPAAILGSIFKIRTIAGNLILPRINPTAPPKSPTPNPIKDSAAIRGGVNNPFESSKPAPNKGPDIFFDLTLSL